MAALLEKQAISELSRRAVRRLAGNPACEETPLASYSKTIANKCTIGKLRECRQFRIQRKNPRRRWEERGCGFEL